MNWHRAWGPAFIVSAWLCSEWAYVTLSAHEGLLTPFGPVRYGPMLLGVAALGLRLVVTFALAPWAAFRLTRPARAPRAKS